MFMEAMYSERKKGETGGVVFVFQLEKYDVIMRANGVVQWYTVKPHIFCAKILRFNETYLSPKANINKDTGH